MPVVAQSIKRNGGREQKEGPPRMIVIKMHKTSKSCVERRGERGPIRQTTWLPGGGQKRVITCRLGRNISKRFRMEGEGTRGIGRG